MGFQFFQRAAIKGRVGAGTLAVAFCVASLIGMCAAQSEVNGDPRYNRPEPNELPEHAKNAKPGSNKPLVFSSRSEYVLVPVIVQDKDRHHVTGLTKDDFTILENGKPCAVASLQEVLAVSALSDGSPVNGA